MVSADRCSGSRQRWSGIRARASQRAPEPHRGARSGGGLVDVGRGGQPLGPGQRAERLVAGLAARAGRGPRRPRCRAPGRSAAAWSARRRCASAACRSSSTSVQFGRRPAVVERRLADQLDLDRALQALDRAHQHVVGVVVGRRPGVRRDRVRRRARGPIVSASRTSTQPAGVCQVVASTFVPGS